MSHAESVVTGQSDGVAGKCPVAHIKWLGAEREALAGHQMLDELRAGNPLYKVPDGPGWYLVTGHEEVLQVSQNAETFPQATHLVATAEDTSFKLIPETLNGPEHMKWRRILAPYFSPGRVRDWDARIRNMAVTLIEEFVDRGQCDFISDFALRYPTAIFLDLMGLPLSDLDKFLQWEMAILHPDLSQGQVAVDGMEQAQIGVMGYFVDVLAKRRSEAPDVRVAGLVTEALSWTIDGEPVKDEDLLSFYLLMFLAGLDTVTAELGYGFLHLATHPEDRARLVAEPEIIPKATEELLRLYPIVNAMREASKDTEVAGCPVRKGEVLVVSFSSAGRDEAKYPASLTADFDRQDLSHLTFGAGPHRCLGSHLARHEMNIAYEEWHKRIPEYRLQDGAECSETSGNMMSLNSLPLVWK
ncbi:cytochrome P450 [Streptomyces sp. NPDC051572]|uniref:cytochrome P450 n=1 Tax=unclassified Streptomyces TaxID=2593676 RepID=UPI00344D79C6